MYYTLESLVLMIFSVEFFFACFSCVSLKLIELLHGEKNISGIKHPAGTSKDSDICDLSNISDIKICIVGNGNIHIFKHPAYLSKDLGEIYI